MTMEQWKSKWDDKLITKDELNQYKNFRENGAKRVKRVIDVDGENSETHTKKSKTEAQEEVVNV
jgi:hypothetical protein